MNRWEAKETKIQFHIFLEKWSSSIDSSPLVHFCFLKCFLLLLLFYICVLCFVSWNCCLLSCLYCISCLLVMLNVQSICLIEDWVLCCFFVLHVCFLFFMLFSMLVNLRCCNYVVIEIIALIFSFHCVFPKEVFQCCLKWCFIICIWLFCRIVFYISIFAWQYYVFEWYKQYCHWYVCVEDMFLVFHVKEIQCEMLMIFQMFFMSKSVDV